MPRIRTIKPEMFESQKLGQCTVLARLTFVGLISMADDEGRGRGGLRFLLGRLHPYAPDVELEELEKSLNEISGAGLAAFYQADGFDYYAIPGWLRHQKIDKPSKSTIPAPPLVAEASPKPRRVVAEHSSGDMDKDMDKDIPRPKTARKVGFDAKANKVAGADLQLVMAAYKDALGVQRDTSAWREWDRENYRTWVSAATKLLRCFQGFPGNASEHAIAYLNARSAVLIKAERSWNLATVARMVWDERASLQKKANPVTDPGARKSEELLAQRGFRG